MAKEKRLILIRVATELLADALKGTLEDKGYQTAVLRPTEGFPVELEGSVAAVVTHFRFPHCEEVTETSDPFCAEIAERGIPFVIVGGGPVPDRFRAHVLRFPFQTGALEAALFGE